ncbi:MAG: hypothetical protein IJF78_11830 [Clostridia bacterium]|nr:hypothetical protein [Clostridia bacterium]
MVGKLGFLYPGKYAFINRGISGDTVDRAAARWQKDTLDENPDILSILLGINGCGRRDGVFEEGAEENFRNFNEVYRSLLTKARDHNPQLKLILIEPFLLPVTEHLRAHYDTFLPHFRRRQEAVRRIADDFGAVFVPIQKELEELAARTAPTLLENGCTTAPYAYWLWDGVHPTEPLHWFIAEKWLEAARDIL